MKKTLLILREPPNASTELLDRAGEVGSAERKRVAREMSTQLTLRRMKIQQLFLELQDDRLLHGTPKDLRMFSIALHAKPSELEEFLNALPSTYPELTWMTEREPKKPADKPSQRGTQRKTA